MSILGLIIIVVIVVIAVFTLIIADQSALEAIREWRQKMGKQPEPPKGWEPSYLVERGPYKIKTDRTYSFCYGALYNDVQIDLSQYWINLEEAIQKCEEHRLKRELKTELEQEYGLKKIE